MRRSLPGTAGWTICLALAISAQALAAEAPEGQEATTPASSISTLERLRELAAACTHLEAAGALDLARQVRGEANRLLQQEGARLAREQEALAKLSTAFDPPQFLIQALLVDAPDLSLEILGQTVRDLGGQRLPDDAPDAPDGSFVARLVGETADADLIQALAASGAQVRILSRPQVRALEDLQAQIEVGEARPVVEGVTVREDGTAAPQTSEAMTGITLAVTPRRTTDRETALEIELERSWLEETETTLYIDAESGAAITSPVKTSYAVRTNLQSNPGDVLLLAIRPDQRPSAVPAARATLIVLLRPRQVPENR